MKKQRKNSIKYQVKVSNDYILAKHDLPASSQDMVLCIADKIQDNEYKENLLHDAIITVDSKNIQEILEIDHRNIRKVLKRLESERIDIPIAWDKDNVPMKYRSTGLVLRHDYDVEKAEYIIHIDEKIRPHFSELAKFSQEIKYTITNKKEHLRLTFKHSKRLYMMFRKIQFQDIWRIVYTIDELNELFKTNYTRYADINRRIIIYAIDEINEKTNINVSYSPNKKGRAIKSITFDIHFQDVDKNLTEKLTLEEYKKKKGYTKTIDDSTVFFDFLRDKYVGKYLKHQKNGESQNIEINKIIDLEMQEEKSIQEYRFQLKRVATGEKGFSTWLTPIKIEELDKQGFIVEKKERVVEIGI